MTFGSTGLLPRGNETTTFSPSERPPENLNPDQFVTGSQPRSALERRTWWILVTWIFIAAGMLRLFDLDLTPLHHDEGVNGLFLTNLVGPAHRYQYDPTNYHGPTLYYFAWLSAKLFGLTTVAIRFVPAFFGLVTVSLLLALRRPLGDVGAIAAAALLAVSPGAVYLSRYFIHESLLVCFTLAAVVAVERFCQSGRPVFVILAALSVGLMFATKETAPISTGVLMLAAVGAWCVANYPTSRQPRVVLRHLLERWRTAHAALQSRCGGRGALLWSMAAGFVTFLAIEILFYSSLFTHWSGLLDALKSFAFWAHTGTSAHVRSGLIYVSWLAQEELPVLALGAFGAGLAWWRRDNRFALFTALWGLGILAAYSIVPYKTPWLTLNMILPLAIIAGYAVEVEYTTRPRARRQALMPVVAMVLAVGVYQAVSLSFVHYDDERYPYVYAHTQRDVLRLIDTINRLAVRSPAPLTIAITSPDHFPLSWYLRYYQTSFYGHVVPTEDPVVIGAERQAKELTDNLGDRYTQVDSYALRPGVRLVIYVRRDLTKP